MITTLCALLMHQALYGPLADIPIESIGTCSDEACVIYWINEDVCEVVDE